MPNETYIECLVCNRQIKPLGLASVACYCASFSIGLSDINSATFSAWPVTMYDIMAIHHTRCDAKTCDHKPRVTTSMIAEHFSDAHCRVNPETLCCNECGADHSEECMDCAGRGYHKASCPIGARS